MALVLKGKFSETTCVRVLGTKFQVSSIILTSFRQGVILLKSTNLLILRLKSPPRLELNIWIPLITVLQIKNLGTGFSFLFNLYRSP